MKITGAVFTAILTIVLVRALGPQEFGVFSLAMGVGGLVIIPSDLGVSQSAARYVAESRADHAAASAVVSDALRLKLVASGVASTAVFALASPIATAYDTPELAWPLRIMALAIFAQSLLMLVEAVFQATGRIALFLRLAAIESVTETGLSIALVLLGTGVSGAMAGRAAGYGFAVGFGLALLVRTMGRRVVRMRGGSGKDLRRVLKYGSALFIVDGAFTLFARIDVLLIGALVSVSAVGRFEAAARLVGFLGYTGQSVGAAVAPRMSSGGAGPETGAFERALRLVIVLQGLVLAPLIVWAEPLTDLVLGPGYEESAKVLRALAPFAFLLGVSPMLALAVNYLGEARRRVPIAIVALAVNAAIDLALLPEIGIVAGAIGTDVAYAFYVGAHLWILKRMVGLPLRPLLATFARASAATAAMAGALAALGTGDVPLPVLLAGGVAGPAVYLMALIGLRELSRAELAAARDWTLDLPRRRRG